jgi:type II secretory ATPase GspE/PulE/Tfp pilus assembly ATPase PilB-like protein
MIAGTFNLVMAQRLARKCCSECLREVNIKETQPNLYNTAKETFVDMKDSLKDEIIKRKINPENWNKFIND